MDPWQLRLEHPHGRQQHTHIGLHSVASRCQALPCKVQNLPSSAHHWACHASLLHWTLGHKVPYESIESNLPVPQIQVQQHRKHTQRWGPQVRHYLCLYPIFQCHSVQQWSVVCVNLEERQHWGRHCCQGHQSSVHQPPIWPCVYHCAWHCNLNTLKWFCTWEGVLLYSQGLWRLNKLP